nr:MAG TPA_asm: hypothetical protein [Caudoviricetes sp.]
MYNYLIILFNYIIYAGVHKGGYKGDHKGGVN